MELALSLLSVFYLNIRLNYAETLNTTIKFLVAAFVFLVKCSTTPFLKMKAFKKIKRCPPITNKILYIPLYELATKIRRQELTSEEVVTAYIQRCREVNPVINAIVENRFEAALEEARDVDRFIKSGVKTEEVLARDTPLLGIPVTVKESVSVKGMSHSAGQTTNKRIVASNDADVVKRVKKAGGIILLVSNTPELCMCWETYNNVTGTTWNPYDTRKTPGGSSGGE
ncbi:fatty-acid amide hydrolase 2-A-like, partial [Chelonus insularis]|uniref:fatty-acid amide hydrolase 2-A-like n=1 Tax=Chelonus insularis TaxID=460826 RepID=UPI00158A6DB2